MYQNNSKKVTPGRRQNRKVQFLLLAIILLLTIIGILVAVYLLSGYNSRNTFEYQYNASVMAYEGGEYDKAISYVDRAIELEDDEEKLELAIQLKYSVYIAKKDYNGAIKILLQMIEKNPTMQRYTSLLELYSRTGNYAQIEELGNSLTGTEYYEIYKNYMVGSVSASVGDGEYNSAVTVELTASKPDLIIHYTTDGTKPTVESNIYNGSIAFSTEGTYILRAIGVNAKGVLSEEITKTYVITLDKPMKPTVLPETGKYSSAMIVEITDIAEGCKAYYTLDGKIPTTESTEYTDPVMIKCGNFVMGVAVADESGLLSDVVWRIYDVDPGYSCTYQMALYILKNKLIDKKIMTDMDGNTGEGIVIKINFIDIAAIDETGKEYYIFNITSEFNGLIQNYDGYYCVSVDDGVLLEVNSINS